MLLTHRWSLHANSFLTRESKGVVSHASRRPTSDADGLPAPPWTQLGPNYPSDPGPGLVHHAELQTHPADDQFLLQLVLLVERARVLWLVFNDYEADGVKARGVKGENREELYEALIYHPLRRLPDGATTCCSTVSTPPCSPRTSPPHLSIKAINNLHLQINTRSPASSPSRLTCLFPTGRLARSTPLHPCPPIPTYPLHQSIPTTNQAGRPLGPAQPTSAPQTQPPTGPLGTWPDTSRRRPQLPLLSTWVPAENPVTL